jgi:Pentapeptide repeats (9 copies)
LATKSGIMKGHGLGQSAIVGLVGTVLLVTVAIVLLSQSLVERDAFNRAGPGNLDQRQVEKITAEIRQIRSETGGSLFWLKMIAVFVTVGGAVGGYLLAQSRATQARLDFEHRKDIDAAFQAIVQELSAKDAPLLRAAAAVKLGGLLEDFPSEWDVDKKRQEQIVRLTKQVLAAALAIEEDATVLKAMSIAVACHYPEEGKPADLCGLNFSRARASDAYWARVDFTNADLYGATLVGASFRKAILHGTQFVDADLRRAVFAGAECETTSFKRADLRNADLSDATLTGACFEDAKVYDATTARATWTENPYGSVDTSPDGDGSAKVPVLEWLHARLSG